MHSLPRLVESLWGKGRAARVTGAYRIACRDHPDIVRDLALFCNAAAPIEGASGFDRGVEEGKRRVWLHIARMAALTPQDFVSIADGDQTHD